MRVTFKKTGGFAGLTRTVVLDTETLLPAEAKRLTKLVGRAEGSTPGASATGARDLQNFEISIEGPKKPLNLRFDESSIPPEVAPLVDFLEKRAKSAPEQKGPSHSRGA